MKVCVCMSGCFPKYWEKYAKSINKNLIEKYNADLYISCCESDKNKINEIKNIYKPKVIKVVNNKIKLFDNKNVDTSAINMFKKIYICDQLRQSSNINYDVIVRIRPEIFVRSKFYIDYISVKNNFIVNHSMLLIDKLLPSDQLFYGNTNVMEKICSLYKNPPKNIKCIHAHYLLKIYLEQNNIKTKYVSFSYVPKVKELSKILNLTYNSQFYCSSKKNISILSYFIQIITFIKVIFLYIYYLIFRNIFILFI